VSVLIPLVRWSLLVASALPAVSAAQSHSRPEPYRDVAVVGGNALLGSLTVIAGHAIRGRKPSLSRIAQGAAAGVGVLAGKRIVADNRWYTNFIGREVAAVASSSVLNLARGKGFADRVLLPWGPVRLHVERVPRTKIRLKLDLASTGVLMAGVIDKDLEVDMQKTFLYGTPVLRNRGMKGDFTAAGSHAAGVVSYRGTTRNGTAASGSTVRAVLGHELVHVIQSDFIFNAWAEPLESYALGGTAIGRTINRYVDLGINVPISTWLNGLVDYPSRPWEREAVSLVTSP
jgi:hypothetical protein